MNLRCAEGIAEDVTDILVEEEDSRQKYKKLPIYKFLKAFFSYLSIAFKILLNVIRVTNLHSFCVDKKYRWQIGRKIFAFHEQAGKYKGKENNGECLRD